MAEEEIKETAAAAAEAPAAAEEVKIKKGKKRIDIQGIACVFASFNNTIVSITDARGNVPFAAQLAAETAAHKAFDLGMRKVDVRVKGAGGGRESAVRALKNAGLEVLSIRDVTGIPHNGCRPKKKRRI